MQINLNLTKLKEEFEQNPLAVLGVGALVTTAAAKLIDAVSAAKGRRAYAKQVDYRVKTRK